MSLLRKVVIVTGASSGIGAETAATFCKEQATVVLVGRNQAKLQKVAEKCAQEGGETFIIKADVTEDEDAKRIINDTISKFGKLNVLINNAGILDYGTLLEGTTLKSYDNAANTNLRAVINLTTLAVPHLIKTKGNIVNISSILASCILQPRMTGYSITKAGLSHFTRGAAMELLPHGVRVNAVAPGPVVTNLFETSGLPTDLVLQEFETPTMKFASPKEIADAIFYLGSDKSKSITGSILQADNGCALH